MPKRMVGILYGENIVGRVLEMRQGLSPAARLDINPSTYLSSGGNSLAVSPDSSYMVTGNQNNNNYNMYVYDDPANMGGRSSPVATFAGAVYCCAASNDMYAFGGNSPYLYVFKKSTGNLLTVNTSGLGTVYALDFSPDGTKLAVVHNTNPFLRIYNTADWSFINGASTSGYNVCTGCFSHDGKKVLLNSNYSPCLMLFNAVTGACEYTNTSGAYSGSSNYSGGARMVRSPLDNKTLIFSLYNSPYLAKFDTSSNTPSLFVAASPALGNASSVWVDPDPEEDAVYVNHVPGSTSPWRTVSKFKISTGSIYPDQPAALFRNLLYGSTNLASGVGIVSTTPYKLTGTVRDINNIPAARIVRAYKRSTGDLMAQTTSDANTGNYTLKLYDEGPYDVQFLTADGELLNDLFYAKAQPRAV